MSFNDTFVVGMVVGGIAVDYIELRIRTARKPKPVKQAKNSSDDYLNYIDYPKKVGRPKKLVAPRGRQIKAVSNVKD